MKLNRTPLFLLLGLLAFGLVVARAAWLSDDAYITFRTVDNFANGYGLTWNPTERVQAYTHPLWMFLLSAAYLCTHEIHITSLALSIAISLAAVSVVALGVSGSEHLALPGVILLTLSKAFVDYSTSGLENPLTHLLLAAFLALYLRAEQRPRALFLLSLLAALGIVNRADAALLFLPPLGYALATARVGARRKWCGVAAGFSPLVAWELFSLFYYGFPFPNTAYAKLNLGLIRQAELLKHGFYYFGNSLRWDPLTLLTIAWGLGASLVLKGRRALPVTAGVVLYLLYTLRIGGDFMSGRFFAAPLLAAVALLLSVDARSLQARRWPSLALALLFGLTAALGLSSAHSPLWADFEQGGQMDAHGVADEQGNYWRNTTLLRLAQGPLPDHDWAREGREARLQGPNVVEKGSVGFYGYFAGPEVHVVDLLALADPLLARLPPVDPSWRVGHYGRRSPDGYLETLNVGENRIRDPHLALYYDKLSCITRGPLWDPRRLWEIARFNAGFYDDYRDAYAFFTGLTFEQRLEFTNPTAYPYVYAFVWNDASGEAYLLDDHARQGDVYTATWRITARGVAFEGAYTAKISSIGPLSDNSTLNVGVIFSPNPDLTSYTIFERRYWFRLADEQLTVLRQGLEWRNEQAPGGVWIETDVDHVIRTLF